MDTALNTAARVKSTSITIITVNRSILASLCLITGIYGTCREVTTDNRNMFTSEKR
jgi:hypothetical protein